MTKRVTIGVDERGNRVGESHHNAKLKDEDVEWMRELYDTGMIGYRTLARFFGVPRSTVSDICSCRRRAIVPTDYRTIQKPDT